MSAPSRLDKIGFRDWAMVAIGLFFTLASLLIMRSDLKGGLVSGTFFGLCLAHAVSVIVRKRRMRKQVALTATVAGGVPIRQSRSRMALMGLALLAVGITQTAFGGVINPLLVDIGWLLLIVGGGLLAGLATGVLPIGFIQFDPEGITFAGWRGQAFVPWFAVTGLARGEVHYNPAVLLCVDAEAVRPQPETYRRRMARQMAFSRGKMGGDFAILSQNYGIDSPVLLAALQRYVTKPDSRQELRRLPGLPG